MATAAVLGLTLSKRDLRRATDRIEREMKAGVPSTPPTPTPPSPPPTFLSSVLLHPTTEKLPSDIMGIHPSLRGSAPLGNEQISVRALLERAYDALDGLRRRLRDLDPIR